MFAPSLAFYGKIKKGKAKRSASEGNVLSSWKLYFAHLNTSYPDNDNILGAIWNQTSNNLFLDLLSEIAKDIGYDFERVQLQTAIYSPVAHGAIENDQSKIRKGLAAIFSGENALKMEIINIPNRQEN
ncbi:DUF6680 family protein [Citrobacter freundii]|uniref:DUF6680 family protein n=1 Tax=Citrobacter freundii TaxID=546 RepID=UPI001F496859|nr:DUF6680 family protein [Citrobacter freundii]